MLSNVHDVDIFSDMADQGTYDTSSDLNIRDRYIRVDQGTFDLVVAEAKRQERTIRSTARRLVVAALAGTASPHPAGEDSVDAADNQGRSPGHVDP